MPSLMLVAAFSLPNLALGHGGGAGKAQKVFIQHGDCLGETRAFAKLS